MLVNQLPLTVNDKVHHAGLKSLAHTFSEPHVIPSDEQETGVSSEQFLTDTERELAGLWENCLGINEIKPLDNFFEIGGGSLLVIRLVGEVESQLEVSITLREVFSCDTLVELATPVVATRLQCAIDNHALESHELDGLLTQIEALTETEALLQVASSSANGSLGSG